MLQLPEISASLSESLQLAQTPVAVTFCDALPEGVSMWSGSVPAGCRFWQEAATKTFATTARQHDLCAIGVHTHNLEGTAATNADLGDALEVFAGLSYVRADDVAQIPVLAKRSKYVVYGPLASIPVAPDVVLLFVQADQTLILCEAAQQIEGGAPLAMGRPACAVIPQTANTGRSALSLGCCGARAYLEVMTENVALFAIPGSRLAEYSERVAALAKANAILTQFHGIRRRDIEAGKTPTVKESLALMSA